MCQCARKYSIPLGLMCVNNTRLTIYEYFPLNRNLDCYRKTLVSKVLFKSGLNVLIYSRQFNYSNKQTSLAQSILISGVNSGIYLNL